MDADKHFQIVQNFFLKTFLVIADSRITSKPHSESSNKWFNLELPDIECLDLNAYKRAKLSTFGKTPNFNTLEFEIVLDSSNLPANQQINFAEGGPLNENKTSPVLEQWRVHWEPDLDAGINEDLPAVYKRGIISIRCLYTLTKLLPLWTVYQRLAHQKLATVPLNLQIKPGNSANNNSEMKTQHLERLHTPLGDLNIDVKYVANPNFSISTTIKNTQHTSTEANNNTSSPAQSQSPLSPRKKEVCEFLDFLETTKSQIGSFTPPKDVDLGKFRPQDSPISDSPLSSDSELEREPLRSKLGFYS